MKYYFNCRDSRRKLLLFREFQIYSWDAGRYLDFRHGPARIFCNGEIQWLMKGNPHRINGPAIIAYDGTLFYYRRGVYSRKNGPAIIKPNGDIEYWLKGKRHREDGPAIINSDGSKSYWLNNKNYTEEKYYLCVQNTRISHA